MGRDDIVEREVIAKMNAYERTLNEQEALRYKQKIKDDIVELSTSLFANCFNFATDEIVQEHFRVLNKKEFYKETKKLYGMIIAIVQKL